MTLPSDPSWVTNVSVPSTLKIGAMMTIWLSSSASCLPSSRSRATSSSASAASGSGGWMLPKRKMTFLPDARACCGDVTRGFDEHDRRRDLAHRAYEHVDDVHALALPLQRVDVLVQLQRRHRAREVALLGDGLQLGGPLPVPGFRDGVAPVDVLRGDRRHWAGVASESAVKATAESKRAHGRCRMRVMQSYGCLAIQYASARIRAPTWPDAMPASALTFDRSHRLHALLIASHRSPRQRGGRGGAPAHRSLARDAE